MFWASLILALLDVVSRLVSHARERQLLDAGRDAEIALQTAKILAMTQEGKRILHAIEGMTDAELDDWLKELGRSSPSGK